MNYSVVNASAPHANHSAEDCSLPIANGVALITVNAMVCLLGTLGNLLVCGAVVTNPRLRRSSSYLLFSLAIADLIVTMICEPLFLAILGKKTFFNDCAMNLERPYQILSMLSCAASISHMASISVDRYIAVVFPLHHHYIMKRYGLKIMLVTSWVAPIAVPSINRFVPKSFPGKQFLSLSIFAVGYLVVFVCYSLIVISLVRHGKMRRQLTSTGANSRVEVRVAITVAIVIAVFTASWFPLIVVFMSTGKVIVKRYGTAFMWVRTLALSNSAMNFLIYGSRMQSFREGFAAVCRKIVGFLRQKFSRTVTYNVN